MDDLLRLAERYSVRAPRYTSYPTAADFHNGIGFRDLAQAIERSNTDPQPAPLSLYLHLPFCHSLCFYCACNRVITRNTQRASEYRKLIPAEAQLLAPLIADNREVEQIHLGGGTPTYFRPQELREMLEALGSVLRFAPPSRSNWSIEIDPRTVSPDDIFSLHEIGFSRLSFGVQDLDPEVQQAINRQHAPEALESLVAATRSVGFDSLNFDLIYGLPHQNAERFERTLTHVIDLDPDRIALYGYAHLPTRFRAQRLLETEALPRGAARIALLVQAIERLTEAGYEYIGMDHFARPGDGLSRSRQAQTLVRNFQGYMPGPHGDLLGLGASAIGSLGGAYIQNTHTARDWQTAVQAGRHPAERGYILNRDDRIRRDVIGAIMCRDSVPFPEFESRHAIRFTHYFGDALRRLEPLERDGLVRCGNDRLDILPRGRLFLRAIAMLFDAHLAAAAHTVTTPRYSQVV
ncbi:MAG: oxygen-independent coproporphyrinogen III oxidase [Gammaproteobacteria bacterium]